MSNISDIKNQPGIIDAIIIPRGVALIGKNTWSVIKAKKNLKYKIKNFIKVFRL